MAQPHLAYPDLALDKFSGTDPDQDAEEFMRLKECKSNFSLGTELDPAAAEHVINLFRKQALFSSIQRGPAAELYGSTFQDAMTWNALRTLPYWDLQIEETKSDTEWKSKNVWEPMEKRLETSVSE